RIIRALADAMRAGVLSAWEASVVMDEFLPYEFLDVRLDADVQEKLDELAARPLADARLADLDKLLHDPAPIGIDTHLEWYDQRLLCWLNRAGDIDVDEWLTSNAPEALAFRNAQRRRGYDPIFAFSAFRGRLNYGLRDEGIHNVWWGPADQ